MIGGIEIHSSPLVPSHVPNITFDPKRKCTWATPEFRASTDKWLLDRFGSHAVAFVFNPRALLGLGFGGPMAVLHPMHAAFAARPYFAGQVRIAMQVEYKRLESGYHFARGVGYHHLFAQWPPDRPVGPFDVSGDASAELIVELMESAQRASQQHCEQQS